MDLMNDESVPARVTRPTAEKAEVDLLWQIPRIITCQPYAATEIQALNTA